MKSFESSGSRLNIAQCKPLEFGSNRHLCTLRVLILSVFALGSINVFAEKGFSQGNGRTAYAYPLDPIAPFTCLPQAINDSGVVVGYNELNQRGDKYIGFVTGPLGVGVKTLSLGGVQSGASGINSQGRVVGSSTSEGFSGQYAFITDPGGDNIRAIGPEYGFATDINDAGQVVGGVPIRLGDGVYAGFFTGPNGKGLTMVGTLGGESSVASFINSAGQIAGQSGNAADGAYLQRAFVTGPNGVGMTDLTLPGFTYSSVSGINEQGQVAGFQIDQDNARQAFVTGPNGVGIRLLGSLGNLPGGISEGGGINDAGTVVGDSTRGANYFHLRVTLSGHEGRMHDLNRYIVNLPAGVHLRNNAVINNVNQIAATGSDGQCYIVCPNKDCQKSAVQIQNQAEQAK